MDTYSELYGTPWGREVCVRVFWIIRYTMRTWGVCDSIPNYTVLREDVRCVWQYSELYQFPANCKLHAAVPPRATHWLNYGPTLPRVSTSAYCLSFCLPVVAPSGDCRRQYWHDNLAPNSNKNILGGNRLNHWLYHGDGQKNRSVTFEPVGMKTKVAQHVPRIS